MKRNIVILAISLIVTGLLGAASHSLAQGGAWKKKSPMPTARSDLAAAAVGGKIYALGGRDAQLQERLATVEEYDPATDTWKQLPDMPTARDEFTAGVVGGKIYVIGGFTTVKRGAKVISKTLSTVEVYDPAANNWGKVADLPIARVRTGSAALNAKIYVIAGVTNVGGGQQLVQVYDPATDKWEKGPDLTEKRWAGSSAAANGKVYALGGFRKEQVQVATVEEYDPAVNQWVKKADLPTPRYYIPPSAPMAGGKIYIIGGQGANVSSKAVEEYDPITDTWTQRTSMPGARMAFGASTAKGKIYVMGGLDAAGWQEKRGGVKMDGLLGEKSTTEVLEYTPPGWPFAVSPQGKLATAWGTIKTVD